MYEPFYKFHSKPFRLTPDPHFFFTSNVHNRALAYLRHGLDNGEGFCVLIGAPGTGKTTLMHTLVTELPPGEVIIAELVTTHLNPDETLQLVAAVLGVPYRDIAKATLLKHIKDFLIEKTQQGKRVLLLVDEAHNLPQRSLEVLRILTNFQLKEKALLQCILLGQESLRTKLAQPRMVHLQQRVTAMCRLRPLAASECKAYVEHRLGLAGWKGDPHFSKAAHTLIFQHASGIPRCINKLCERLLLYGAIEELHDIDANNVAAVINELALENNIQANSGDQEFAPMSPESSQIIRLVAKKSPDSAVPVPVKEDIQKSKLQPSKTSHNIQHGEKKMLVASVDRPVSQLKKKTQAATITPPPIQTQQPKKKKAALALFFSPIANHQVSWLIFASITVFAISLYTFYTSKEGMAPDSNEPQWAATTPTPPADSLTNVTTLESTRNLVNRTPTASPKYTEFWEPEYKIDSTTGTPEPQATESNTLLAEITEQVEVKEEETVALAPTPKPAEIAPPEPKKPVIAIEPKPKKIAIVAQSTPEPKAQKIKPASMVVAIATEPTPVAAEIEKITPSNTITQPELTELLAQFSSAYEQGNVTELMSLFAEQARTNDRDNAKSIEEDYRKLFEVTEGRRMGFEKLRWQQEDGKARGIGEFKVTVHQKGRRRGDEYSGNITLQIEKNAPNMLITELYYEYD